MATTKNVWIQAAALLLRAFKRLWPWFIFSQGLNLYASSLMNNLKNESENVVIGGAAAIVVVQLVLAILGMVIVNQVLDDIHSNKSRSNLIASFKVNLKYLFINYARAILRILVGFILLIVPGCIWWVQLTFVPYVVLFDPEFKSGAVDALEKSKTLVRGRFWRVTGVLILCLILSMVPEFWCGSLKPLEAPLVFSVAFIIGMGCELYGDVALYCLYRKISERTS